MVDTKKLEAYVLLKNKIKTLEDSLSKLGKEIKDDVQGKIKIGAYVLAKREKITFSIKEGVSLEDLEVLFPDAVEKKIKAKEVYRTADKPEEYVNKTTTEYLEVRAAKEDGDEIDF